MERPLVMALVWFFCLGGLGIWFPFYTLYLHENAGLSGVQVGQVMAVLLEAAKGNPDVLQDPEPFVLFMGFGDSSLDFEVRAWTGKFEFFQRVRSELCVEFEASLRAAGIQIPFPQRDLHIRSVATAQAGASPTSSK